MGKAYGTAEILELRAAERLQLMEEIWDSLDPSSVPIPDWHRTELDRRLVRHAANPDALRPWSEVKARLTAPPRKRRKS